MRAASSYSRCAAAIHGADGSPDSSGAECRRSAADQCATAAWRSPRSYAAAATSMCVLKRFAVLTTLPRRSATVLRWTVKYSSTASRPTHCASARRMVLQVLTSAPAAARRSMPGQNSRSSSSRVAVPSARTARNWISERARRRPKHTSPLPIVTRKRPNMCSTAGAGRADSRPLPRSDATTGLTRYDSPARSTKNAASRRVAQIVGAGRDAARDAVERARGERRVGRGFVDELSDERARRREPARERGRERAAERRRVAHRSRDGERPAARGRDEVTAFFRRRRDAVRRAERFDLARRRSAAPPRRRARCLARMQPPRTGARRARETRSGRPRARRARAARETRARRPTRGRLRRSRARRAAAPARARARSAFGRAAAQR